MAGNLPRHTSQSNSGPARFTKSTAGAQKVSGNQTADNIQTPSKPGWHLQVEAHFKKKASGVIELLEELGIEEMADLGRRRRQNRRRDTSHQLTSKRKIVVSILSR